MIWIYIAIGACSGLIGGLITKYYAKNEKEKRLVTTFSIILFIFSMMITKYYVAPYYISYKYENTIKNRYPVFELLSKRNPIEFKNYINSVKAVVLENNQEGARSITASFILSMFGKYAQSASNQSIYNYLEVTNNFYKIAYSQDPSLILYFEFPNAFDGKKVLESVSKIDDKYFQGILTAKYNVIESGINNQSQKMSEEVRERADIIFRTILKDLMKKYGTETVTTTFSHPNANTLNKSIAAEIVINLYQSLILLGPEKAALAFKYLLN